MSADLLDLLSETLGAVPIAETPAAPAAVASQRRMVERAERKIADCDTARKRGEHTTGDCDACGFDPAEAARIRTRWEERIAAARARIDTDTRTEDR